MAKKTSTRTSGGSKKTGSKGKPASKPKAKPKAKSKVKPKAATKNKPPAATNSKSKAKPASKAKAKPVSKTTAASKSKRVSAKTTKKPKVVAPKKTASKTSPPVKPRAEKTHLKISKPPATAIAQQPVEHPEPPTIAELRKADSGLTRQEKEQYRKLLMEKRAEILGDVASLKDAALATNGNLSNMPLHMADVGSDQYEQEAMLGLVESERRLLSEINDALVRLHEGTYGVCVESGKPIGKPRLDVTPWAKYTIEVVREKERMSGRR